MSRSVRSPDGRIWRIERIAPDARLRMTRREPFFWSSVIATVLLFAFAARMIWVDPGPLMLSIVVPLLVIWLLERDLNFLRPNIRAHTGGPPAETSLGARPIRSARAGSRSRSRTRSSVAASRSLRAPS